MGIENMANQDFERAVLKAFWRKVLTRLTGKTNDLMPFDNVRARLPLKGQHYIGLKQVMIDQIVGSSGRYRDFDRAFLPLQTRTRNRWVSIDMAHYEDVILPPVDLYKMGEVYFVKDGNHRVSVARERGQVFIDAYVTEIDLPVLLTPDSDLDELVLQQEHLMFMEQTRLAEVRPGALIEVKLPGQYGRLLEHIATHRWFLGEQLEAEVPYAEAVASWYDLVYMPVIEVLREYRVLSDFKDCGEADLYLWIIEYQWYLRRAYREDPGDEAATRGTGESAKDEVGKFITGEYPHAPVRRLVSVLKRTSWIDDVILLQGRAAFLHRTRLNEIRPDAQVVTTVPVQYETLLDHIDVHRWYLGEQRGADVPYAEAVASWYDNVYMPLVQIIREQGILEEFPGRTETDLYLWIIAHEWDLRQVFGDALVREQVVEQFAEDYSPKPASRLAKVIKKVTGKK